MGLRERKSIESRFRGYVEVIGHADRAGPLRDYCTGLVAASGRKSVEPMAAITAPEGTAAQHQSLLHFIGQGAWSDGAVLAKVREMVLPRIDRHGAIQAWIVDDTSFPKKGAHSVGVAHQYRGQLGKQANCQVAVSLSLANDAASLPVAYRLYLPKNQAEDNERRCKAGIPEEIGFKTKPEIALEQIQWACEPDLPGDLVVIDAGYGNASKLRRHHRVGEALPGRYSISDLGLEAKPTARPDSQKGRRDASNAISVKELAVGLRAKAWHTIEWREGTNERLSSRFARARIHVGANNESEVEEWLLIEWPKDENEPTKYWLSTLPRNISFRDLVDAAKLRWRIERAVDGGEPAPSCGCQSYRE